MAHGSVHPYATEAYAASLSHVGAPLPVPEWGTPVLVRDAGMGRRDAAGPYPLTVLGAADVAGGLARLRDQGLVSVILVVEQLPAPEAALASSFDLVRPFKTHHLHDPALPARLSAHHRRKVDRALRQVRAEVIHLADHLPAWMALYAELTRRRGLSGVHDFPAAHHAALARLPGVTTIGAFAGDDLVGAHVFVGDDHRVTSHLVASGPAGYGLGAAHAINAAAIDLLGRDRVIDFGGGAGPRDDPADGLWRFKAGFANASAPSHLLGAVLDEQAYADLVNARRQPGPDGYFPAYRG